MSTTARTSSSSESRSSASVSSSSSTRVSALTGGAFTVSVATRSAIATWSWVRSFKGASCGCCGLRSQALPRGARALAPARAPRARPTAGYAPPMPVSADDWTVADLIDFEMLLASPGAPGDDRRLFESRVRPQLPAAALDDRRAVLRAWLQARRVAAPALTAGTAYERARRGIAAAGALLGFLGGAALAGSLLAQAGGEPVNALLFLFWTLGLQWLLLALAAAAWAVRRFGIELAPLRTLVEAALSAATRSMRRLRAAQRDPLHAAAARLQQRSRLHGGLLRWPALILLQQVALAFNLGILLAMLLVHLPFAELRFGWQSTYRIEPQQVHRAIEVMAAPWSRLAPAARPSLEDIRATRYTRGQNAQTLPSTAGRAWWPFLVAAIACYGLLLRALLLAASALALRRRLRAVDFLDAESNALWRRLRGPVVGTNGGTAALPEGAGQTVRDMPAAGAACLVLLSEELDLADERLREQLQARFGWTLAQVLRLSIDDRQAAAPVPPALRQAPATSAVVVVAPASRDPIVAVAMFLRAVSAAAAPREVTVLLCGGDGSRGDRGDRIEGPTVDDERHAVWRRFIAIQQLDVGLERWS